MLLVCRVRSFQNFKLHLFSNAKTKDFGNALSKFYLEAVGSYTGKVHKSMRVHAKKYIKELNQRLRQIGTTIKYRTIAESQLGRPN